MNFMQNVDKERIYRTILDMEGEKHPILTPLALENCASYLKNRMTEMGLTVREQTFSVGASGLVFKNIEGSIGPVGVEPAAVLMAHYDTAPGSPGANDDASGIAAMLEIARVLSRLDNPPPVYFVAVTLEEDNNPTIWTGVHEASIKYGIRDASGNFAEWEISKAFRKVSQAAQKLYFSGKSYEEAYLEAVELGKEGLPANIRDYFNEIAPLYRGIRVDNAMGRISRIGSYYWLKEALEAGKKISFNITMDEIGTYKKEPGSQKTLAGVNLFQMFTESHRTDSEKKVGDFLLVVSDAGSKHIGEIFAEKCKLSDIDLPFGWVHLPLDFQGILSFNPTALSSDHAHFWKAGIPSIFVFDSSVSRDTYVHSPADTIDKLDFDRIAQVTLAVLTTLTDLRSFGKG